MRIPADHLGIANTRPILTNDKCPDLRCTGVAVSVAVGLLETTYPHTGACIMLFAGGPATEGSGMVASNELKEAIRFLPNSTNGVVVLSDSFTTSIFEQSFLHVFNKDDQGHLSIGFNVTSDVQVSLFFPLIMHISEI